MTARKTKAQAERQGQARKPTEEEAAAARQRARDRAGEEGLPKSSGAPRRGTS